MVSRWTSVSAINTQVITVDPIAEKYYSFSPYVYAANNPIKNIDLLGKDIFDVNGNLINTDNTNIIRIQTNDGLINLSAFSMSSKENRHAAGKIAKYYGTQVGIYAPGSFGAVDHPSNNSSKTLAYTKGHDIILNSKEGYLNRSLDNIDNMKSTLYHEKLHKDRGQGFRDISNLEHAQVYLDQMKDDSFKKTTNGFKKGIIGSASDYIEGAAYDVMNSTGDLTQLNDLIKAINDLSDVTGYNVSLRITSNGFSDPSMYEFQVNVYERKK